MSRKLSTGETEEIREAFEKVGEYHFGCRSCIWWLWNDNVNDSPSTSQICCCFVNCCFVYSFIFSYLSLYIVILCFVTCCIVSFFVVLCDLSYCFAWQFSPPQLKGENRNVFKYYKASDRHSHNTYHVFHPMKAFIWISVKKRNPGLVQK